MFQNLSERKKVLFAKEYSVQNKFYFDHQFNTLALKNVYNMRTEYNIYYVKTI